MDLSDVIISHKLLLIFSRINRPTTINCTGRQEFPYIKAHARFSRASGKFWRHVNNLMGKVAVCAETLGGDIQLNSGGIIYLKRPDN